MKEVKFGIEARRKIMEGINILSKAVTCTLGPRGRNVVIELYQNDPIITKDGVTVARNISFKDPYKNTGATIVKNAAEKTNSICGDGTTTSIVLVHSILQKSLDYINNSENFVINPVEVKRGIDKMAAMVLKFIEENSTQINNNLSTIENIATISANNEEKIGKLIVQAIEQVGTEGVITVEESKTEQTYVETEEGLELEQSGWMSPYFVTNMVKMEAEFKDPLILVCNHELTSHNDMLPFMQVANQSGRPLVIFCDNLEGTAAGTILENIQAGRLRGAVVRTPGIADKQVENMLDMTAVIGGKVIDRKVIPRLKDVEINEDLFGSCDKIVIGRYNTTIIKGKGDPETLSNRLDQVREQLKNASSEYDRKMLQKRLGKLAGGVGVIYVGAESVLERGELKDRVEDALNATRAAIEEGIIPGGGTILAKASYVLQNTLKGNEKIGADILLEAILSPIQSILRNAGVTNYDKICKKVSSSENINYGYNAASEEFMDMIVGGVIDPAKVTKTALKQAVSIASTLITTESIVIIEPEEIQVSDVPELDF